MTDQVVPESWYIPRALSNEALRLLTTLPLDEIERRLRMDGPTVPEGREPAAVEGQPSDGEVAELVAALRMDAECVAAEQPDLMQMTDKQLTRAADSLKRQATAAPVARLPEDAQVIEPVNRIILAPVPTPIPVSERPWERQGWCNKDGRCWFGWADEPDASWSFCKPSERDTATVSLPAHALPLPEVE